MATGDVSINHGDYLFRRTDRTRKVWLVRYPVPSDLQSRFGKRVVRTTGTTDEKEAKKRSRAVIVELDAMFDAARAGMLTPADIESEAKALYLTRLAEYAEKPDTFFTGGDGIPSEADGVLLALTEGLGNELEGEDAEFAKKV